MDIKEAVEQLPHLITERGTEYAESQAEYEQLDKTREVLLSKIMNDTQGTSEAEKKRIALSSEAYEIHLSGLREAREKSLKAKARYEAVKAKMELIRSLNSREVALSKLL